MKSSRIALAILTVMAVVGVAGPARAATNVTAFTLDSEPGDWVGSGLTFAFVSPGATVSAQASIGGDADNLAGISSWSFFKVTG